MLIYQELEGGKIYQIKPSENFPLNDNETFSDLLQFFMHHYHVLHNISHVGTFFPIVIVTSLSRNEDREKGRASGEERDMYSVQNQI